MAAINHISPDTQIMAFLLSFVLVTYFMCLVDMGSASWWSLGATDCATQPPGTVCEDCAQLHDTILLTTTQKEICEYDEAPVQAMARGVQRAIMECQRRFACGKWNCSTFSVGNNLFGAFVTQKHTLETAVLNALLTAGAVHAIAEACHEQRIKDCPCVIDDESTEPDVMYDYADYEPEGNLTSWDNQSNRTEVTLTQCADHVEWALEYVMEFVDPLDSLDLWNVKNGGHLMAGNAAHSSLTRFCTCHGLSGACTVMTCYQRAPHISEVGEVLLKQYEESANGSETDLWYNANSPDFCVPDSELGVLGTAHRRCDPNSKAEHGCGSLCCGRGYYNKTVSVNHDSEGETFDCCDSMCGAVESNATEYIEHRCNPE